MRALKGSPGGYRGGLRGYEGSLALIGPRGDEGSQGISRGL